MATAVSAGLGRLVAERIASEAKLVRTEFALCFATILCALAGASVLWRALRDMRDQARERAHRRRAARMAREQAPTRASTRPVVRLLTCSSLPAGTIRLVWGLWRVALSRWLVVPPGRRKRATRRFRLTALGMQIDTLGDAHSSMAFGSLARLSGGGSEQSLHDEELAAEDRSAGGFEMAHAHGQIDSVLIPQSHMLGIAGSSGILGMAPVLLHDINHTLARSITFVQRG